MDTRAQAQAANLPELEGGLESSSRGDLRLRPSRLGWWVPVAALVITGTVLHLWYLYHRPINSDQAVVGLMASQILHGHFTAFYWGQQYGGSAEAILIAIATVIFGASVLTMNATVTLCFAVAAILTWRVGLRLVRDRWLAAVAAGLTWVAPQVAVGNGSYSLGFRGVTLVCGLLVLLGALRALDGHQTPAELLLIGLVAGVGWWSSPEILYFVVPASIILVQMLLRDGRRRGLRGWAIRIGCLAAGTIVGALPWIWANVGTHLASLRAFQSTPGSPDFASRLGQYPRHVFPMLFSLRQAWTGEWLGGPAIGKTLTALAAIAVVGSVVVCLLRGGRHMALAIGVLAYPVILALSKQSFFWQDGRYAGYDVPLLSLVMAAGVDQVFGTRRDMAGHLKRSHRPKTRMVLAGVAAAVVGLSLANFSEFVVAGPGTKWGKQPDAQTAAWARGLESAGVTVGFANYWVAFNLDLLSGEKLRITGDPNRWSALNRQVRESPTAAWLFVQPSTLTFSQFAVTPSIDGPGLTEPTFLSYLHRAGYHYKRIRVGPIDAVIPDHRLIPEYVIASA